MSLNISGMGTRDAILRKVDSYFPRPTDPKAEDKLPHGTDRPQLDAVKACIAAEIAALDPKVNGVRLVAESTAHPNGRSIQISIFPQELHV